MISPAIINSLKNSVCAIGYFSQDPDAWYSEAKRDAQEEGGEVDLRKMPKQVIGSGFLVSDTVVLSNRHVADALQETKSPSTGGSCPLLCRWMAVGLSAASG